MPIETVTEYQMRDGDKLFQNVPLERYQQVIRQLEELRIKHPYYRDDQLLVYLLCMYGGRVND